MPKIMEVDGDLKYKYISNGMFISDCLLNEGKECRSKNSRVSLVTDFTHDTCMQK